MFEREVKFTSHSMSTYEKEKALDQGTLDALHMLVSAHLSDIKKLIEENVLVFNMVHKLSKSNEDTLVREISLIPYPKETWGDVNTSYLEQCKKLAHAVIDRVLEKDAGRAVSA